MAVSAGYKQIGVNTWGMISGDANADGEVPILILMIIGFPKPACQVI